MLPALKNLSSSERQQALAALALDLLPHPNDESQFQVHPEARELFAQVCESARVSQNDHSPATIYRLHSLLMNELRTLILPSDKIKEVRSRVGRTGFLPIELYELRFSDSFK